MTVRGPHDRSAIGARIFVDLDIAVVKADNRALGLLGVERKAHDAQLLLGIAADDAACNIDASLAGVAQRNDLGGLARHKQAHNGQCIHANIEHGTTGEVAIVETVGQVAVLLVATKVELSEVHAAELAGIHAAAQLLIQGHVEHRGSVHKDHVVLGGNGTGLIEFSGIEGNGLFAEHVLAGCQGSAQIGDMSVVRGSDVDGVDVRIGVEVLNRVVDLLDAILIGKSLSLGQRAVGNARKLAAGKSKGLSHLVGDNAATDHGPTELGSRKNIVGERLVLDRSERCFGGCRGVERSLLGIYHHVPPVS